MLNSVEFPFLISVVLVADTAASVSLWEGPVPCLLGPQFLGSVQLCRQSFGCGTPKSRLCSQCTRGIHDRYVSGLIVSILSCVSR